MLSLATFMVSAIIWLLSKWKYFFALFVLILTGHFIYKQTILRWNPVSQVAENVATNAHRTPPKAKSIELTTPDTDRDFVGNRSPSKLTSDEPLKGVSENDSYPKDSDTIFSAFSSWIEKYKSSTCTKPDNCLDHDPRHASNLLLKGIKLSRTRASHMSHLISNNPQKAIELAIPQEVIESLPQSVSGNLEKWQSGLIDVDTWHACSSRNHKLCKIEHLATFNEDEHFEMYTYGQRKNLPSVKGLSAWGISLGNKFAMSDQAVLELSTNHMGVGELIFAGIQLRYDSAVA